MDGNTFQDKSVRHDTGMELYNKYLLGDDDCFREIICQYRDGLLMFLKSMTGRFDIAEELTEDTFVTLAIKKPFFARKSSFKTWLYAMGRNQALKYLRKSEMLLLTEDIIDNKKREMVDLIIENDNKKTLYYAINHLKADYGRVLVLSFFEDFNNAEIAVIMKKSKRQVENLLYNAKKALKKELLNEGFEYDGL